ncbi:YafY family transcriptional regulator, partial [Paenibacillus ginsengarvi]
DKLLAFGDKCEVVEPADIRLGFRAYVRGILAKYEQD